MEKSTLSLACAHAQKYKSGMRFIFPGDKKIDFLAGFVFDYDCVAGQVMEKKKIKTKVLFFSEDILTNLMAMPMTSPMKMQYSRLKAT
ncbi:MAG: hypothetical protein WC415_03760 [Patescibacteria group bacterium]|jgi:hypothetical protein